MAEVSDSIHLRRFCRISLSERVPDDSTVRKLTRRIGPDTVNEITRVLIVAATRSKRFRPQGREDRFDGDRGGREATRPTPGWLRMGSRVLAREGEEAREAGEGTEAAGAGSLKGDGSHVTGGDPHDPAAQSGEAKAEVLKLTAQTGELLEAVDRGDPAAGGDRAPAGARAWRESEAEGGRATRGAREIGARRSPCRSSSGSLGSRSTTGSCRCPIRTPGRSARGSSGSRTEFGYVSQLCEVTENTRRGARGLILPARDPDREPGRGHAPAGHGRGAQAARDLPERGRARRRLQRRPDQPDTRGRSRAEDRVFISGRQQPGSKRTQRRLQTLPNRRRRDGSATSNAATDWTDPASKATKASRSGPDGRSSPTTLTRSPSGSGETLPASSNLSPLTTKRPRPRPARPFRFPRPDHRVMSLFLGK